MKKSRAIFAPSVSHNYARAITRPQTAHRNGVWPQGLTPADLDFLNPNSRLCIASAYLISPGQYLNKTPEAYPRAGNRTDVVTLGDSGGYQAIDDPAWYRGRETVVEVLHWQERNCDVAPILDIPSRTVFQNNPRFDEVSKCLEATVQNIEWALATRTSDHLVLLNVIQGNDLKQALAWYDGVKSFALDGWAFGGETRLNLEILTTLLIRMRDDDALANTQWMHMFGTGRLDAYLIYTAIRSALESLLNRAVPLSFDCSTPFTETGLRRKVFGLPTMSASRGLVIQEVQAPDAPSLAKSELAFPYSHTKIGKLLKIGDLCVNGNIHADHAWDTLSYHLLYNHNMEAMSLAYDWAGNVFDLPPQFAAQSIPSSILEFADLIVEILRSERPMSLLKRHQTLLSSLTK